MPQVYSLLLFDTFRSLVLGTGIQGRRVTLGSQTNMERVGGTELDKTKTETPCDSISQVTKKRILLFTVEVSGGPNLLYSVGTGGRKGCSSGNPLKEFVMGRYHGVKVNT